MVPCRAILLWTMLTLWPPLMYSTTLTSTPSFTTMKVVMAGSTLPRRGHSWTLTGSRPRRMISFSPLRRSLGRCADFHHGTAPTTFCRYPKISLYSCLTTILDFTRSPAKRHLTRRDFLSVLFPSSISRVIEASGDEAGTRNGHRIQETTCSEGIHDGREAGIGCIALLVRFYFFMFSFGLGLFCL